MPQQLKGARDERCQRKVTDGRSATTNLRMPGVWLFKTIQSQTLVSLLRQRFATQST
ncbi:MAG: hypothetical protein KME05_02880 [Gloeocapsa sp. UFS-A4-WI-NPMV-4B04]|nr:hypothetical protein [Gloeocapsa sp. UFS-A4-WI-NPMV-4B04]